MFGIQKVDVASVAKVLGVLYAIVGLILGAFFSALAYTTTNLGPESGIVGTVFGTYSIVALPITYGIIGVISGALTAVLYNTISRKFGRIKIELIDEKRK